MCSYEDKAKPATLEMLELIKELCPHLVVTGNTHVCCSINQLKDMKKNFELPASLIAQTCPTCYHNFKRNFCDLTCHPEQSKFLRVDSKVDGIGDGDYTGNERFHHPMYRERESIIILFCDHKSVSFKTIILPHLIFIDIILYFNWSIFSANRVWDQTLLKLSSEHN